MALKYYCGHGNCQESFYTVNSLFQHFQKDHPDLKVKDWGNSYTQGFGYSKSRSSDYKYTEENYNYRNSYNPPPPPRPPPPPEIKSDLVSVMKSRGRGEGEINAFFNLAGKFSGLTIDELKTLQLIVKN